MAVLGRLRQHSMLPLRKHHDLPQHAVAAPKPPVATKHVSMRASREPIGLIGHSVKLSPAGNRPHLVIRRGFVGFGCQLHVFQIVHQIIPLFQ
jgi:hypothetical protein